MKKQNVVHQSDRSKVRIFFVDADLAAGDLETLTTALTQAIRPTHVLAKNGTPTRLAAPASHADGNGRDAEEVEEAEVEVTEETDETPRAERAGPAKKRTYPKPIPVDIDLKTGAKPWAAFAAEKGPTSHRSKYLVAAAWLHEYRQVTSITANHVFTCYKAAGWSFDVQDPSVTLRQLKGEGLFTGKGGKFEINHLGVDEVEKMKAGS